MASLWLLALLVVSPAASLAGAAPDTQHILTPDDTSWQRYVRAPLSSSVSPVRVLPQYTLGNVSNSDGLINGRGPALLSRASADADAPTLVIDFGRNLAGILSIAFASSSSVGRGLPGVRLAFSETLRYLTDRSDFTRSDNASGVRARPIPIPTPRVERTSRC